MKHSIGFIFIALFSSQSFIKSVYSEEYIDAVINNNAAKILNLNNQGCNINSINPFTGETHLGSAAAKGQVDIIRALLLHGADPRAKNINGSVALDWAKAKNDIKVINLLSSY